MKSPEAGIQANQEEQSSVSSPSVPGGRAEALTQIRGILEQASDALLGVHGFAKHDNVKITYAWSQVGGALALLSTLARAPQQPAWQPIETAPERRKVLVSWVNELGKRRTALARFYPAGTIELDESPDDWVDDDGRNMVAGWWEAREAGGDDWYLDEKPTHWMPLPSAPQQPEEPQP